VLKNRKYKRSGLKAAGKAGPARGFDPVIREFKLAYSAHRLSGAFCLAALALFFAGCSESYMNNGFSPFGGQNNAAPAQMQTPAQTAALEGRWVDPNGIASTFHNGVFETRSPDTNEKLSEGNYVFNANNILAIEVRSLVRGTVSHVNCQLNGNQLFCTSENNTRFILTRS